MVDGSRRLAVSSNSPLSFPSPTSTWQCLTLATPIASQLRRRRKSGRRLATSGAWRRCRRRRRAGPRQNGEPRRKKHGYDDERRKLMRSRTPTMRMHVRTYSNGRRHVLQRCQVAHPYYPDPRCSPIPKFRPNINARTKNELGVVNAQTVDTQI